MSSPIKTTTELIQDDITELKLRIAALEAGAATEVHNITQVYRDDVEKPALSLWQKVEKVVSDVSYHAVNLSKAGFFATGIAFLLKLIHG